jgi:hypothetical protein
MVSYTPDIGALTAAMYIMRKRIDVVVKSKDQIQESDPRWGKRQREIQQYP